jgi:hypothetical protein
MGSTRVIAEKIYTKAYMSKFTSEQREICCRYGSDIVMCDPAMKVAPGMKEPAVFTQQFAAKSKGDFSLVGPIAIQDQPLSELDRIAISFSEGIQAHPKGHLWASWHGA